MSKSRDFFILALSAFQQGKTKEAGELLAESLCAADVAEFIGDDRATSISSTSKPKGMRALAAAVAESLEESSGPVTIPDTGSGTQEEDDVEVDPDGLDTSVPPGQKMVMPSLSSVVDSPIVSTSSPRWNA